jgi:glutathione peroxidase
MVGDRDSRGLPARRRLLQGAGTWVVLSSLGWASGHAAAACPALLTREFPRLQDEKPVSLCRFAGQVLVVVNTASLCGFTSQYRALEELNRRFADEGLAVLGFPSNDFGGQEPGSAEQIAAFCENNFGVRFPMFTKSRVSAAAGADRNPLFTDLARLSGASPRWNFHKYLVARDGRRVTSFDSQVDPLSAPFVAAVRERLASR